MSYLSDLNEDPNNYRYIDAEKLIEYIFAGFEEPLPVDRKRELIGHFGRPRRANATTKIEGDGYTIDLGPPPFETQVICKNVIAGDKVPKRQ